MASALQIKANQARRHGLLARDAVLPEEDRAAYIGLLAALEAEHQPHGPTQTFLVHQLASAQWRLQRLLRIEAGLFATGLAGVESAETGDSYDEGTRLLGLLFLRNCNGDCFIKLARCQTMLNREYYRALKALRDARRPTPPARTAPRPQPIGGRPAPQTLHEVYRPRLQNRPPAA